MDAILENINIFRTGVERFLERKGEAMYLLDEDLARNRVEEAISKGLAEGQRRRMLGRNSNRGTLNVHVPRSALVLFVFCIATLLALILGACSGTAVALGSTNATEVESLVATVTEIPTSTAKPTVPPTATATKTTELDVLPTGTAPTDGTQRSRRYTIALSAEAIAAPEKMWSGLAEITLENSDSEWHAAILRRLNDDVSLDEFSTAFQEDPFSTMPLTFAIGGPDVGAGESVKGMFFLNEGTYIVVDNWVEPPRFTTITVEGQMVDAAAPEHDVTVKMEEYAFTMPDTISSGPQMWKLINKGQYVHNFGVVQLEEGKTVEDIIAWMGDQQAPWPMQEIFLWNVMSPSANSWAAIDLPEGEYIALDFLPDFANEGGWNMEQGMYKAFTVTP
jgi:hypothetical protein